MPSGPLWRQIPTMSFRHGRNTLDDIIDGRTQLFTMPFLRVYIGRQQGKLTNLWRLNDRRLGTGHLHVTNLTRGIVRQQVCPFSIVPNI